MLPDGDGPLLVVVGEVSVTGFKAATTMTTTIGARRNESSHKPGRVLANLNRLLHSFVGGFVTGCTIRIDADGRPRLAHAEHLAPYRNGDVIYLKPWIR